MLTYEDIKQRIQAGAYIVDNTKYPVLVKMSMDTIIDPEKSAEWNYEQMEERELTRIKQMEARREANNKAHSQFVQDVISYIKSEFTVTGEPDLPDDVVDLIYMRGWNLAESVNFAEVLESVHGVIEFLKQLAPKLRGWRM